MKRAKKEETVTIEFGDNVVSVTKEGKVLYRAPYSPSWAHSVGAFMASIAFKGNLKFTMSAHAALTFQDGYNERITRMELDALHKQITDIHAK